MKRESLVPFRIVAIVGSVLFVVISLAPRDALPKYRYSFLFLVPILWGVLAVRRRLALRPVPYALFALALALHDLGAFGFYQRHFVGLQYDWYVHFYFGVVGGLIVARALHVRFELRGVGLALFTVLLITGIGGIHEIMEAASSIFLGPEYGMLNPGPDNPYDTQEDLLNNVLGSSLGVALHALALRRRKADRGE